MTSILNRIDFKVLDDPKHEARKAAFPLVNFVNQNSSYLLPLCEALYEFTSSERIVREDRRGRTAIDKLIVRIHFSNEKDKLLIGSFKQLLLELYNTNNHNELQDRRGMVLELLIREFVYPRCCKLGTKFSQGCMVIIDGREIRTLRNTVDIGCWNGQYLELYETKVGPEFFDGEVIEFLCLLKYKMNVASIAGIVGCVTMASRDRLENRLKNSGYDFSVLTLYGRNEIVYIKQQPMAS